MKKLLFSTLLATSLAFTQNAFAAKCDVKKIGHVDENENIIGLSYDKFKISFGKIDGNKGFYENIFFKFSSPNENLTPKYINEKEIKKECLDSYGSRDKSSVQNIPIYYFPSANALVIKQQTFWEGEGAGSSGGTQYKIINTKNGNEIERENLLTSFKDKNFNKNLDLLKIISRKLKEKYDLEWDLDVLEFPDHSLGIENIDKNGGNVLVGIYSGFHGFGEDGLYTINFYPNEINPFLKENSILYKLLNNK